MSSPGGDELPKICCSECLAKILEAMQHPQGAPMTEEESPNEDPLPPDDEIFVIRGLEDDELSDDNIILVMGMEGDISEDDETASIADGETASNGDGENVLPGKQPENN
ncbi:uncharacterized protein LOC119557441 [Drosophila subpulchrella]|uniref:uncharacterized protein LOC119557441 n=1 Tax=Drosophila subpulchrella TaxID=1486046 RepID=UPI0018A17D2A|nr:uncharacterized protein LOC119557441 [Drosophila subpulchrella]